MGYSAPHRRVSPSVGRVVREKGLRRASALPRCPRARKRARSFSKGGAIFLVIVFLKRVVIPRPRF